MIARFSDKVSMVRKYLSPMKRLLQALWHCFHGEQAKASSRSLSDRGPTAASEQIEGLGPMLGYITVTKINRYLCNWYICNESKVHRLEHTNQYIELLNKLFWWMFISRGLCPEKAAFSINVYIFITNS